MFDAGALIFKLQTLGAQVFKQDQADAKKAVEDTGKAAQTAKGQVDGLGTATDETGKKSKASKKPLDDQAKATEEVGKKSKKASEEQDKQKQSTEQQIEAAKKLSVALLAAGAAVAALVTLAVVKNTEFDAAMSNVRAATMATAAEQKKLGEAALEAGADTAFSASEAAAAEEELAKAGLSVAEVVGGSLNGALALAAAGQLQVARSAEIMATTLKQYRLEGKDASHVSDLLAAGAGKAQGSVDDLALALQYVGPVAAGLGISLEETTGTLALFASQGQLGERAGTGLRGVLMSLTSPSALAAKTMKDYNVEIFDGNGKMKSLAAISQQLKGAFGGLTEAERSAALGRIFGNEQITAARVLYEGGAQAVEKWTDAVDESGYAARQASMRQDNLAGDIEKLGGAFDTALIKSGSTANDVLRSMVQGITEMVDMFGEAPAPVQQTALVIGVAAAAMLLFAGGAVGARAKFLELKLALDATSTSMTKTAVVGGAAGLALAGIITVVGLLMAKQAAARAVAESYADTLDQATGKLTKASRAVAIEELQKGGDFLTFNWQSAADAAQKLGADLNTVADAATGSQAAMDDLSLYFKAAAGDMDTLNKIADETGMSQFEVKLAVDAMTIGITEQNSRIKEGMRLRSQEQEANEGSVDSSQSAADAYLAEADSVEQLNNELSALIDQINEANGTNRDAISANIDYQETLRKVEEQVASITAGTDGYARSLDITTVAGSENMAMLVKFAEDAESAAEAQLQVDKNTSNYTATLEAQRQKLYDAAKAMGASDEEAAQLRDTLLGMPPPKTIQVLAETATAKSRLHELMEQIRLVPKTIPISTSVVGQGTVLKQANGGIVTFADGGVRSFANGGTTEHHVAQLARAGEMRVWAEPETGGEAYIPLAPSKRARSEAIMVETAARLGGTYIPSGAQQFASGDMVGAPAAPVAAAFPETVTLVVDGQAFTAYVQAEAGKVQRAAATPWRRGGRRS
ncbi:phage tail tape measure protein [Streptomyces sp. AC495_CC817]|uniref:phage tail tape measure protein n=1 Tax=Streptomyces sp. AC495_CC817 TaxID=2823900 RepID=UPI001C2641FF|nr:phage tail tape measure protein [Streptomyces sp. AC495_CC817]